MRKVENSIAINVKPSKIFASFLDPKMLRDWWGVERTMIEAKKGGNYALVWGVTKSGFSYITTGVISAYEENSLIEIDNFLYFNPTMNILGPTTLRIEIDQSENETSLTVCQSGYQRGGEWDWYYNAVYESWPSVLISLKNYLEKITRNA